MTRGVVAGLARWPVKSMAGERLRGARLDGRGVGGDRTHALLEVRDGQQGRLLTASRAPRLLAWAAAYPDAPDDALDPAAPPLPSLRAPDGTVWGWDEPGLAAAIGADLGVPVEPRRDPAGQQDLERSVLMTTEASRRALEAALGRPVDLRRFRTNLHLDVDAPAFAEERWQGRRLQAGPVTLDLLHPCERCVIPTRDPDGQERWPELLPTCTAPGQGCSGSTRAWSCRDGSRSATAPPSPARPRSRDHPGRHLEHLRRQDLGRRPRRPRPDAGDPGDGLRLGPVEPGLVGLGEEQVAGDLELAGHEELHALGLAGDQA